MCVCVQTHGVAVQIEQEGKKRKAIGHGFVFSPGCHEVSYSPFEPSCHIGQKPYARIDDLSSSMLFISDFSSQ